MIKSNINVCNNNSLIIGLDDFCLKIDQIYLLKQKSKISAFSNNDELIRKETSGDEAF